ncbi:MAG: hypothetical protein V8R40_01200 [Dysosmobacter sp.]
MTAKEICSHRLTIVTGHYGTGKTEFSVNLALALAGEGEQVMMADLDIVNPYFRSRERKALLEDAGIRLICSSQACSDADVPALPAEVLTILENRDVRGVLDIGGDPVGARVLARFRPKSPGGSSAGLRAQRQPSGGPRAGERHCLSAGHRGHHRPYLRRHREQHAPLRRDHRA